MIIAVFLFNALFLQTLALVRFHRMLVDKNVKEIVAEKKEKVIAKSRINRKLKEHSKK
jgi:hypothetical protein